MAQSPKPSLWPLVTGIYPIPSAGRVSDDLFLFLHAFIPLITFGLIRNLFRLACFVNSSTFLIIILRGWHGYITCGRQPYFSSLRSFSGSTGAQTGVSSNRLALSWLTTNFFLLYAAWVRSRAERPSVSYTKVVMEVAWTGHNLQFTKTN